MVLFCHMGVTSHSAVGFCDAKTQRGTSGSGRRSLERGLNGEMKMTRNTYCRHIVVETVMADVILT